MNGVKIASLTVDRDGGTFLRNIGLPMILLLFFVGVVLYYLCKFVDTDCILFDMKRLKTFYPERTSIIYHYFTVTILICKY